MQKTAKLFLGSSLTLAVSLSASAQQLPPVPPAPTANPSAPPASQDPVSESLSKQKGISRAEAKDALERQSDVQSFLENSGLLSRPDFIDLVVRYKPYQMILTFEKDVAVNEVVALVPNKLRRYVKVRKAKNPKAERRQTISTLEAALGQADDHLVTYDTDEEMFVVDTKDATATSRLELLVPANLKGLVNFRTGALSPPTIDRNAVPRNVRPGDWATAGYSIVDVGGDPVVRQGGCTLGYPVTFGTNMRGILTAAHCMPPKEFIAEGNRRITYPDYYNADSGPNSDFALFRTDGLNTDYQVYYFETDNFRKPRLNASGGLVDGWLWTKNFIRQTSSWVGMYTCMSGSKSGLKCGTVENLRYPWHGTGTEFVRVVNDTTLATYGDSGGPAFVTLNSARSYEITATGIVVSGTDWNGQGTMIYVPIDRTFTIAPGTKLITTP